MSQLGQKQPWRESYPGKVTTITRRDNGVLVLHGRRSGAAEERPCISSFATILRPLGAQRKKRLHGEDEALIHEPPLGLNRPGCDFRRLLMQRMPDAMARKILNKRIAVSASERADRLSDVAERLVRANLKSSFATPSICVNSYSRDELFANTSTTDDCRWSCHVPPRYWVEFRRAAGVSYGPETDLHTS